jgi:putative selenate reductase FAD-binding subunit
MVQEYARPATAEEALGLKEANPGWAFLAGGTFLLAGDHREKPRGVIDLGGILPRGIERRGKLLVLGSGATFQDIADSRFAPLPLKEAALSMVNRNVRNRATVGGNLAAAKSCASLVPVLLVLGARVRVATALGLVSTAAAEWMAAPRGILLEIEMELEAGAKLAFARYARTSCDLSVLTAAVAWRPAGSKMEALRIAMGGLGPRARDFPEIAALFSSGPLPSKEAIEAAASPFFKPRADFRGSAAFKTLRAAALLADALHKAEEIA